jgi:hypothetical protein
MGQEGLKFARAEAKRLARLLTHSFLSKHAENAVRIGFSNKHCFIAEKASLSKFPCLSVLLCAAAVASVSYGLGALSLFFSLLPALALKTQCRRT